MNDERPIEKLLRRFAKQRREETDAPLELHPATRRLLQGEVSRQFPKGAARKSAAKSWWKNFWPQLAWGVWILLFVGIGAWMLFRPAERRPDELQLAQNAPASIPEAPAEASAPSSAAGEVAPPVPEQPALAMADKSAVRDDAKLDPQLAPVEAERKRELAANRTFAESDTVTREPGSATVSGSGNLELAGKALNEPARRKMVDSLTTPAPAAAPPQVAAPIGSVKPGFLARGGGEDRSRAESLANFDQPNPGGAATAFKASAGLADYKDQTQRFAAAKFGAQNTLNYNYANLAKTKAPVVLANFRLEQTGDQLRVIDADGSSYTGALELVQTALASSATQKKGAALLTDGRTTKLPMAKDAAGFAGGAQAQALWFRVSGTNRTLNQPVSFAGNLSLSGNQTQNWQFQNLADTGAAQTALKMAEPKQPFVPLLQNAAISGRAQVGGREFEINAVQVAK